VLLHSEAFNDGQALLRVAEKHGLEGVVSKRRDTPYRSGQCRGWRKVKTAAPGAMPIESDGVCLNPLSEAPRQLQRKPTLNFEPTYFVVG
jgi:hypothetical protein